MARRRCVRPPISSALVSLEGQVAVVTGASKGIGLAIVHALADAGMTVCAAGRDSGALFALAESDDRIHGIRADVTSEVQVATLANTVAHRFSRADLLINNAGVSPPILSAHELPAATWWRTFEVNLYGSYLCSRAFIPIMRRSSRPGRIVNIASRLDPSLAAYSSAYAISKDALVHLTAAMQAELPSREVVFLALRPGLVDTPMVRRLVKDSPRSPASDSLTDRLHRGEALDPQTIGLRCAEIARGDWDSSSGAAIDMRDSGGALTA